MAYASDRNVQIIISLLKQFNISNIIASAGSSNRNIVISMQNDKFFNIYSCIDERSAAYMAVGMASELNQPVVIICTESTASRDYLPGITEANHRKLPILAITCMHNYHLIGHLQQQVIDRSVQLVDTYKCKADLVEVKDEEDTWFNTLKVNEAILALWRNGGGPAMINLPTPQTTVNFNVANLDIFRKIERFTPEDQLPCLAFNKVCIYIGSHHTMNLKLVKSIEEFCEKYNAVVFSGLTSGYHGKYQINPVLLSRQSNFKLFDDIDLIIHMGEEGEGAINRLSKGSRQAWRISEDGEIRDTFRVLKNVFEMKEEWFFEYYNRLKADKSETSYYKMWFEHSQKCVSMIPNLPFSNIGIAKISSCMIPVDSNIYFAGSNTIRSWTIFPLNENVNAFGNMGCRGIDGVLSSCIGVSLCNRSKCFCIIGDLTFFYDMNALGNRHISNNLRVLLVNNGSGGVTKQSELGILGDIPDSILGGEGHFGRKSTKLVKHYAEDLGFMYMSAQNEAEYIEKAQLFFNSECDRPILFEVFTDVIQDLDTLSMVIDIYPSSSNGMSILKKLKGKLK